MLPCSLFEFRLTGRKVYQTRPPPARGNFHAGAGRACPFKRLPRAAGIFRQKDPRWRNARIFDIIAPMEQAAHLPRPAARALASLAAAALLTGAHAAPPAFATGADLSWTTELEARGYTWRDAAGVETECFALMKSLGVNAVRLRVWVDPKDGWNAGADLSDKARRAARLRRSRRAVKTRALLRTDSPALRSHQRRNSALRKTCSPTISRRLRQMFRDSSE